MSRSRSLRSNVLSLLTWLVATALISMVLLFTVSQARALTVGLARDAEFVAELLIEESSGPLLFVDRRALADKFRALRVYPSIALACLYGQDGRLLAGHSKDPNGTCPESGETATLPITLQKPVLWHDATIGRLDVYADRGTVLTGVLSFVAPMTALALFVFLTVSVVGRRLAQRAASPLRALTASSRKIVQGDLSERMAIDGPQEVRELAQAFNAVIDDLLAARLAAEEDLRERRRTEEALSAAESLLRKIIDLVPYLIFAVRSDGSLIFANRAVADAYGVSIDTMLSGGFDHARSSSDGTDGLLFEEFRASRPPTEIWFNSNDGTIRRYLVTRVPFAEQQLPDALPTSELVVAVDVTEERRLQVQLQFSQRLEVVGTLAGGIAHDFNNLLTPIMGYTSLLMDRDFPADVATKLKAINSAALKARDLVLQILTFSRHQSDTADKQLVSATAVLDDAISLMRATIPSSIDINVDVAPDVPLIHASPGQVHQVIVNLCTNAAQAIRKSRGRIDIQLRSADRASPDCPARVAKGEFIELTVSDDGAGMSDDVRARIFEPFFTTKDVGQGSGLGLSVVHGIVTGHGGEITLATREGLGSTFRVFLPAAPSDARRVDVPSERRTSGSERVLLIDDEVEVVRATKDLLESFGYEVQAFTLPASALRQFKTAERAFDVVLTDNLMPQMTGLELAHAIRESDASIPIVLMSGYLDDKADRNPAITVTISKPTSGRELSNLIQQIVPKKLA